MTNSEIAEIVALTACVVDSLNRRKSATSPRNRVNGSLGLHGEIHAVILEALEKRQTKIARTIPAGMTLRKPPAPPAVLSSEGTANNK